MYIYVPVGTITQSYHRGTSMCCLSVFALSLLASASWEPSTAPSSFQKCYVVELNNISPLEVFPPQYKAQEVIPGCHVCQQLIHGIDVQEFSFFWFGAKTAKLISISVFMCLREHEFLFFWKKCRGIKLLPLSGKYKRSYIRTF